jgi:hypothetical protein
MGSRDLKEMDADTMDSAGRGTAQVGKICGIIATILLILGAVIFTLFFLFGFAAAVAHR